MFHKKIDKMQSDIEQMVELCDEATGGPENEFQDLGVLILMAQDGELDKQGYQQLEKQLAGDKRSLGYYIDFQWLSASLHEHFGNHQIHKMIEMIFSHSPAHPV